MRSPVMAVVLSLLGATSQLVLAADVNVRCTETEWLKLTLANPKAALNYRVQGPPLVPQSCHYWELNARAYLEDGYGCMEPGSVLVLEFWSLDNYPAGKELKSTYLAVSRTFDLQNSSYPEVVNMDQNLGLPLFEPPVGYLESNASKISNSNTYIDEDAVLRMRPYQRIVLPMDALSAQPGNMGVPVYAIWQISIMNMQIKSSFSSAKTNHGYHLRAQCTPLEEAPCPRTSPDWLECGGSQKGTCIVQNTTGQTTRRCQCLPGWGGVSCNERIVELRNGVEEEHEFTVRPDEWKYFRVDPGPRPPGVTHPSLLVELTPYMESVPFSSGDPIMYLEVVPPARLASGSSSDASGDSSGATSATTFAFASLPWRGGSYSTHMTSSKAYEMYQDLHYVSAHNWEDGTTFVVGVYNSVLRQRVEVATLRIKARWSTYRRDVFCPDGCNDERGRCITNGTDQPTCSCTSNYGGPSCEGQVTEVKLTSGSKASFDHTALPHSWNFYRIYMDEDDFLFGENSASIEITFDAPRVGRGDRLGILTKTRANFPTALNPGISRQLEPTSVLPILNQQSDSSDGGQKVILPIGAAELESGYFYIVGVYNTNHMQFSYTINIRVPKESSSSSWMKPYVRVILGMVSFVLLCGTVMIGRRFVLKMCVHRQPPPPPFAQTPLAASLSGARMATQMSAQRSKGVPVHVVNSFETFIYKSATPTVDAYPSSAAPACVATGWAVGKEATAKVVGPAEGGAKLEVSPAGMAAPPTLNPLATRQIVEDMEEAASKRKSERARIQAEAALAVTNAATAAAEAGADSLLLDTQSHAVASPQAGLDTPRSMPHHRLVGAQVVGDSPRADVASPHPSASFTSLTPGPCQPGVGSARPGAGEASSRPDGEEHTCTVCLCEYEDGDEMRRLPCRHEFHIACIDKWMTQHTTCPVCRTALVQEPSTGASDSERNRSVTWQERSAASSSGRPPRAVGSWLLTRAPAGSVQVSRELARGGRDSRTHGANMGFVLLMYRWGQQP